ncbi:hypothetical protein GCM10010347_54210 [Streptomyces cirratus]|uniref:Uncharacterized protein n=1 Tax=Streptomyces cirratus TaxID=68187 RepID=A0ABQ3EZL7_9ACTN|nr:hypothetical protein GCM10010347_54210 [Streptomyces cirratus]
MHGNPVPPARVRRGGVASRDRSQVRHRMPDPDHGARWSRGRAVSPGCGERRGLGKAVRRGLGLGKPVRRRGLGKAVRRGRRCWRGPR